MKIYRNSNQIYDLSIDDKTTIKRRLMVENSLNLSVAVAAGSPLDLKIGDYTDVDDERYIIMDEPQYSLRNGVYEYSILMRGNLHRLEVYMMPDGGRDEWFYYGSVVDQINKVVAVLNAKEAGWDKVLPDLTYITDNSPKNINYANMSILSAFHAICSTENGWGLEFDVVGKVIKFAKEIKTPTTIHFEYGKGKGLYELTRGQLSGEGIATRIIGYGSKTNMPVSQRLSFESVNDGKNYVDCNVDLYGLRETRVNLDHIYPRLKDATILSDAVQIETGKANWTVSTALDFDLKKQVAEGAIIMFQTGDCVGVEFEIMDYDHVTKTLTFKENVDDGGAEDGGAYVLPNVDRKPKVGDQYVLVNILMPDSYVANAKIELKQAIVEEAAKRSVPQRSYTVKCDPRFFKTLGVRPMPGDTCRLVDAPHGVDYTSRIVEVNYPLIYPNNVDLVLADKVPIPSAVVLAKSVKEIKTKLGILDRAQLTENELRRIFHPLGGSADLDMTARKVVVPTIESPIFGAGIVRSGYQIFTDPVTNKSTLSISKIEADELVLDQLTIQRVQAIGGVLVLSQAYAKIVRVENLGSAYRCYYIPDGGVQLWKTGDQALCKDVFRYYWRLVTSVSESANDDGEHWFNLSATQSDGSAVPAADDEVVLLGHRGDDLDRRGALVLSSGTLGYPDPFTYYQNVNSFSLAGKENIRFGRESILKVKSFAILNDNGSEYRVPCERGAWSSGHYSYYDRVSHSGSMWLCIAEDGTDVEPSEVADGVWLRQVSQGDKGEQGSKGDYTVQAFRWAESKPARPVGSSPEGWSVGADRGRALTDHSGAALKDEQGNLIVDPYPDSYKLWGSTATFSGATDELVGEWSDTYQVSGESGKPGTTPIIYELVPSATAVKKDTSGVLSPSTVSCRAAVRVGNEREVIGVDDKIEFEERNLLRNTSRTIERQPGHYGFLASYACQKLVVGQTYVITVEIETGVEPLWILWAGSWGTDQYIQPGVPFLAKREYVELGVHDSPESMSQLLRFKNISIQAGSSAGAYQPAPEDYAIQLNNAAYTAGTAITPTDNLNWTLHDPSKPTTAEPIDRKTTVFQEDIEFGGVNLMLNSQHIIASNNKSIRHTSGRIVSNSDVVYVLSVDGTVNSSSSQLEIFIQEHNAGEWPDKAITEFKWNYAKGKSSFKFNLPANKQPRMHFSCPFNQGSFDITAKLEKGNRATDWSPAPEDVQADITAADAKATAAKVISEAINDNFTEIQGGLILSSMLSVRDQGKTTAGICGKAKDPSGKSLPALWGGGSYEDAVSRLAKFIVTHGGDVKIGQCEITPAGALKLVAVNNSNQDTLLITSDQIKDISTGNDSQTVTNVAFSISGAIFGGATRRLPNSIYVRKNGVFLKVSATISCSSRGAMAISTHPASSASAWVALYLCKSGSRVQLGSAGTLYGVNSQSDQFVINSEVEVNEGTTYWLELDYSGSISVANRGQWQAAISASTMSWSYIEKNSSNNVKVGCNGISVARSADQQFTSLVNNSNGICKNTIAGVNNLSGTTKITGSLDAPGLLLWAGCDGTNATFYEGPKQRVGYSITRQSEGVYRVYHSIGHEKYAVNAGIQSAGRWCGVWYYENLTSTSVDIIICGLDSTPRDKTFTVTLIGKNTI